MTERRKKAVAKIKLNLAMGRCMNHPISSYVPPHGPPVDGKRCEHCANVEAESQRRARQQWHETPLGVCRVCDVACAEDRKLCSACSRKASDRRAMLRREDPTEIYDRYRASTRGSILRTLKRCGWMSTADLRETLGVPSWRCRARDQHHQMLSQLTRKGFVEKRQADSLTLVFEYRITDKGRAELEAKQSASWNALVAA